MAENTLRPVHGKSLLLVIMLQATGASRTVWNGVYTSDQAIRGQAAFADKCASCHGEHLEGTQGSAVEVDGSPLAGSSFIEKWREDDLGQLFKYIQVGMPRDAANTVADGVKIDILAFILRTNGFPAGSAELNADVVGNVMLVRKDGPKPLPNMTAVRAVGCLAQESKMWFLTHAREPVRTRAPDQTNPEELKSSQTEALGTLTFNLPSLDFALPGIKPGGFKGHKVQVKGVLYRQPNNQRITVTSFASLAATCAP